MESDSESEHSSTEDENTDHSQESSGKIIFQFLSIHPHIITYVCMNFKETSH